MRQWALDSIETESQLARVEDHTLADTLEIACGTRFLASMTPGQSGRVTLMRGPTNVRHRLMEMGLTPGTDVRMIRVAPLGDPIEIQLRNYRLSLRRSEAADIEIEAG